MPADRCIRRGRRPARRVSERLSSAIDSIWNPSDNAAADSVQKFLTGENEELHTTILATQKAELAFELGLAGAQQGCRRRTRKSCSMQM